MGNSYEEMDSNAEKGWGRLNESQFSQHMPNRSDYPKIKQSSKVTWKNDADPSQKEATEVHPDNVPPEPPNDDKNTYNYGDKSNDLGAYAPFKKNERFDGPPGAGKYTSN